VAIPVAGKQGLVVCSLANFVTREAGDQHVPGSESPFMRLTEFGKAHYKARVKKQGRLLNKCVWAEADFASHSVGCEIGFRFFARTHSLQVKLRKPCSSWHTPCLNQLRWTIEVDKTNDYTGSVLEEV
jgi:hypothetical protein